MKTEVLKKITALVLLLSLCGTLAACGNGTGTPASDEKTAAVNEVSYTPYSGEYKDLFLSKGDRIAVISPSSTPSRNQVDAVIKGLKAWGYTPVEGKYVCVKERSLEDCRSDLEWALEDPDIKAVFCVRGGYGASDVMDILPLETIISAQKLIIGYSDITVYHSAWTAAGLPSIHASMSAAFMDLPEDCAQAEEKILRGEIPQYQCESSEYCRPGEAEGILIGGNLSTFTSVLGTAYDCTRINQPYILFFEDVEEDLQHIHRYLTILKHLGILDRAEGIIFGEWTDLPEKSGDYEGDSRGGSFLSVDEMIARQILGEDKIPAAFGFPAGHGDENYPLLLGEKVHLSVSEDSYTISWAG